VTPLYPMTPKSVGSPFLAAAAEGQPQAPTVTPAPVAPLVFSHAPSSAPVAATAGQDNGTPARRRP
jgi:hypothetical protein